MSEMELRVRITELEEELKQARTAYSSSIEEIQRVGAGVKELMKHLVERQAEGDRLRQRLMVVLRVMNTGDILINTMKSGKSAIEAEKLYAEARLLLSNPDGPIDGQPRPGG